MIKILFINLQGSLLQDICLLLLCKEDQVVNLKFRHSYDLNVKFTLEKEESQSFNFIDIKIGRKICFWHQCNVTLLLSVYDWSIYYKLRIVLFVLICIFSICSKLVKIHQRISWIKEVFMKRYAERIS